MSIYELVKRFKQKYPFTVAWRLKEHARLAEDVVDEDEEVRYIFAAQKNDNNKDLMSTNIVLITTSRLIFVHNRIFPGQFVTTITKDMVNDINIKGGIIWGKIIIDSIKEEVTLSNIDIRAMNEISNNINDALGRKPRKKKYWEQ